MPVVLNTATSLNLLRCRDSLRSRSLVTLIKGLCIAILAQGSLVFKYCNNLLINTGIGQRIDVLTSQSTFTNQSIHSPIN
jgi:hypothetical protein